VLLADMNDDINSATIQQFCRETNLVDAISELHGLLPIPMHQWGWKAINGIFMSRILLNNAAGSILQFGQVTHSDHCALWIDIQANLVEMEQHDPIARLPCQRLKCNDPRIVQWYNQVLLESLEETNVESKVEELMSDAQAGM